MMPPELEERFKPDIMAKKKHKRVPLGTGGSLGHSPFGVLGGARGVESATGGPEAGERSESPASSARGAPPIPVSSSNLPKKVVVRKQRKGRGGKTVTLIEGLEGLEKLAVEELAKQLRSSLGCGSSIEGTTVVLQGDLGSRVEKWLREHGVREVRRSS